MDRSTQLLALVAASVMTVILIVAIALESYRRDLFAVVVSLIVIAAMIWSIARLKIKLRKGKDSA